MPFIEGQRIRDHSTGRIWQIISNQPYWIPNEETYDRLYRDGQGLAHENIDYEIWFGTYVALGSFLAKAPNDPTVWVVHPPFSVGDPTQPHTVSTGLIKEGVATPAAMDRYYFDWDKVQKVDPYLLAAIPTGGWVYF